jgi:hypothetical protein
MFLLIAHSTKVNFVEFLFTCITRRKENIKMNDAIKSRSNFLYAKKSRIRNPRGDFSFFVFLSSYEIIKIEKWINLSIFSYECIIWVNSNQYAPLENLCTMDERLMKRTSQMWRGNKMIFLLLLMYVLLLLLREKRAKKRRNNKKITT